MSMLSEIGEPKLTNLSKRLNAPILAVLIALSLSSPALAGKWMTQYESLIESGQLDEILAKAKAARDAKRNDPEAWLEYAYVAKACGDFTEARDAYAYYAKEFPLASQAKFAQAKVKRLQKDLDSFPQNVALSLSDDDYYLVDRLFPNGVFMRFDERKMPLKVFSTGADSQTYRPAILTALANWSQQSNNLISFQQVPQKEQADIEIAFTSDVNNERVQGSSGNTKYKTDNGQLKKASIMVLTTGHYTGKPRSMEKVSRTVSHELGHALGLAHSKNSHDLMYFAGNWSGRGSNPSERDLRVLNLLYQTPSRDLYLRVLAAITQIAGDRCPMLVRIYDCLGEDCHKSKAEQQALAWFEKADRLAIELKDNNRKANLRRMWFLSTINFDSKNYTTALLYYKRRLEFFKPDDPERIAVQKRLEWCERYEKDKNGAHQRTDEKAVGLGPATTTEEHSAEDEASSQTAGSNEGGEGLD